MNCQTNPWLLICHDIYLKHEYFCGQNKKGGNDKCWLCNKKDNELNFIDIIKNSNSYLEAAIKLKTSRPTVIAEIKRLNLNIKHFKGARNRFTPKEKILCLATKKEMLLLKHEY